MEQQSLESSSAGTPRHIPSSVLFFSNTSTHLRLSHIHEVQFLENNKPIEINHMLSTLIIKEVEFEEILRLNIIEGKTKKKIEQRLIENYSENPLIGKNQNH